jgi:hypothetical protein
MDAASVGRGIPEISGREGRSLYREDFKVEGANFWCAMSKNCKGTDG